MGIIQELQREGYSFWTGYDEDRAIAHNSTCQNCGHQGLTYHAYSRGKPELENFSYRAIAECCECDFAEEF